MLSKMDLAGQRLLPMFTAILLSSTAPVLAQSAPPALPAAPAPSSDFKYEIHGNVSLGTTIRTDDINPAHVYAPNAAQIGLSGTNGATGAKNYDDGDANFRRGQAVSTVLKAFLDTKFSYQNYGAVVQGMAWKDFVNGSSNVAHGNSPNGYAPNTPLSDLGFEPDSQFSGFKLGQAYAFGQFGNVNVKVGEQRINWGLPFTISGGLSAINGVDLSALHRAGSIAQEAVIPMPATMGHIDVTKQVALEGWFSFQNTHTVLDSCGTFYSVYDFVSPGCNKVYIPSSGASQFSDSFTNANGLAVNRYYVHQDYTPEFGIGGTIKPIDGLTVGAYYAHQTWRTPSIQVIKGSNAAFPYFNPADPTHNPQYALVFAEQVDDFSLNAAATLPATKTALSVEATYRPNQPFNLNNTDILNAALSPAASSLLRNDFNALAAGGRYNAFDRHETLQMNFGVSQPLPGTAIGAKGMLIGAELAWKHVFDLPDQSLRRYGRITDFYGQGPVGGACAALTVTLGGCDNKGYFSQDSVAIRAKAGVVYEHVMVQGLTLTPSASYGWDISGWSYDNIISEGRQFVDLQLRADYKAAYALVSFTPQWGGLYNPTVDRSVASAVVGVKF